MNFEELIGQHGIYFATFIASFVSGFLPLVSVEAYLAVVSAISPRSVVLPVIILSTVGQMTAKSIMYLSGLGFLKLPIGRYEKRIEEVREKFEKWAGRSEFLIFVSALTGLPPFYVVTIVAGMLKLNFPRFFIVSFTGRLLRFAVVVYFPQVIKAFWP